MVHPEIDGMFEVTLEDGHTYSFDHFEEPASALTPRCEACGQVVTGPGVQLNGARFCDALCAEMPRLIQNRRWQVGRR